jgi:hypothetical protein
MKEYVPEDFWKECEKCRQRVPPMGLFRCKGQMVCEGCFKQATDGNTKFIDEGKYPRNSRGDTI